MNWFTNQLRNWRAKRRAEAERKQIWREEFEEFVRDTAPSTPKAPRYPAAALYRQVWKRSIALGSLAQDANRNEDYEKYVQFRHWAAARYFPSAPRNLYGKVRLNMTPDSLKAMIDYELRLEAAEEERRAWERSGRYRGIVYLLKSGDYYKIGMTTNMKRRFSEMKTLMPDPVIEIHKIVTNDPQTVEKYWHSRFSSKRKNGEWFGLDEFDIAEFQRYVDM